MSTLQNAIVVDANGCVSLQRAPIPEPGPDEILVKVVAAAQNPGDWMSSQRAKVAGAIIGFDYAGYVERNGSTIPGGQRTIGERVCGFVHAGYTPNGTFAEFVVAPAHLAVPIPDDWSFENAAQLALAPFTALQALYESLHGLPTPDAPTRDSWPILIYGASSSVGVFTLQIAKLAGMHVVATASPANFDIVKFFGADEVFDYKDPDVSRRIREATRGKLRYAVDCIANEATLRITANALGDEGGDIAAVLPGNSPRANVKVTFSLIFEWIGKDYTHPYPFKAAPEHRVRGERFAKMFSRLLNTGSIKPGPVRIMPNGLAGVPDGLKYMLEGKVSGEKLVYVIKDTPPSATTGTSESS